jgi:hypothetical protein
VKGRLFAGVKTPTDHPHRSSFASAKGVHVGLNHMLGYKDFAQAVVPGLVGLKHTLGAERLAEAVVPGLVGLKHTLGAENLAEAVVAGLVGLKHTLGAERLAEAVVPTLVPVPTLRTSLLIFRWTWIQQIQHYMFHPDFRNKENKK